MLMNPACGPLFAATAMSPIGLAGLEPGCDPMLFIGLGVNRNGAWRLIDDQVTPVRGFGKRHVELTGVAERLAEGESLGLMAGLESSSAQIEAGYKIALNEGTTVTPYISFAMGRSTLSGSAHEDGTETAAFALDYAAQSADLNTTSIGVRIAGTIGKATTFFSDIGLSDATRDGMTDAFTEAEGSEFNVNAAGAAGPQLNAAFGAAFQTGENSFASVGLGGSFLSGSEDLNGSLSFRHSW